MISLQQRLGHGQQRAGAASSRTAAAAAGGRSAAAAGLHLVPHHHAQQQQQQQHHHHHAAAAAHAAGAAAVGVCLQEVQVATHAEAARTLGTAHMPVPLVVEPAVPEADFSNDDFHARFTLTGEILGQGTYGTVRVCTDSVTGLQHAVKILPKMKMGEDRTSSIAREVHIWRKLADVAPSHIVGLAAAYQDANNIFIVQELLTGGDLQGVIDEQGVLPEPVAASAMRGVLQALAACHAADCCYGDVKPANFMLMHMFPSLAHRMDPSGSTPPGDIRLKAVDFGCAQFCPDGCQLIQGLSGTPVYIAPEVISQHCYSMQMDVWGAGVVMYHALTGQFPFWDTNLAGLARLHPRRVIEDVRDKPVLWDVPALQALSPEAKDLLRGMLEKDPAKRLTAAAALQHPWLARVQQQ